MPGFEPDRFVNNSGIDLDEFTCGICHLIFIKPVLTDCCQQTYCCDCINQWLNQSKTCPNDRKSLTTEKLRPTSRAFINLLDNLKIICDYKNDGCLSVVKISDLDNHIKECEYRPNTICKVCQTIRESVSSHNCVESLLFEKNDILAKNNKILGNLEENYKFLRNDIQLQQNNFEKEMDKLTEDFESEMSAILSKFRWRMDNLKSDNVKKFDIFKGELEKIHQDINEYDQQTTLIKEAREHFTSLNLVRCELITDRGKEGLYESAQKAIMNTENNSYEAISQSILKNIKDLGYFKLWKINIYFYEINTPKPIFRKQMPVWVIQIKRLHIEIYFTKD